VDGQREVLKLFSRLQQEGQAPYNSPLRMHSVQDLFEEQENTFVPTLLEQ